MADYFSGEIHLGGSVTESQFEELRSRLESITLGGLQYDGVAYFYDIADDKLSGVLEYCEAQKIVLFIQKDANAECNGTVEYYYGGKKHVYAGSQQGEIMVPISELIEYSQSTVQQFIDMLNIPDFPPFEIVDDCE